jgi:oligogalacturonide lyase
VLKKVNLLVLALFILLVACRSQYEPVWTNNWECEIYPAEQKITTDPDSGAKLIFVTTDTSRDNNLYFDWNCWFQDLSMMTFLSWRTGKGELFGYLPLTGELVRLNPGKGADIITQATVDYKSHDIYVRTDSAIYQWNVQLEFSENSSKVKTASVKERKIVTVPDGSIFTSALSQSADCQFISATTRNDAEKTQSIVAVNVQTGEITTLLTWDQAHHFSHVQFSKYNPHLLRFSYHPHRMWYINTKEPGIAHKLHLQEPGELVTHEDWWVNDQMTFCGGYRTEHSHLKIINIHTQKTRILGGGSWLPEKTPYELSQFNWWHASGSLDGKWVAADNWHGHIGIVDERTSHLRLLTTNHRVYGSGDHPHVGWAPDSKSVEFTSLIHGNADVCIAHLPKEWYDPFVKE